MLTQGPPYVFDPNATYPDPNAQAWAQYYAQGGTDPAGAVYFVSVPGVTGPAPASGAQGGAQSQAAASAGGGGANVQRAGSYQAQGAERADVQRSGSYQAGGGLAQQQQQHQQQQPQQHQQSAPANATRYQLSDSGFQRPSAGSEAAAPQAQGGYFGANNGAAVPVSTSPTAGSPIAQSSTPSWVLPKKVAGGQKPVGAV